MTNPTPRTVYERGIDGLKPNARNPRTHTKRQLRQIAASIKEFGWTNPILIDTDGGVIAGHGRLEAAKLLGMDRVPCIRLDHMTEAQKRAYIIADNRLAEKSGWDHDLLVAEFQYIAELDLDFDVEVTGFDMAEIDLMIEADGDKNDDDVAPETVPELDRSMPVISRLGDLWTLGRHRLLCGDATDKGAFDALMGKQKAQMVITDPPYNVRIDGHVCGSGAIKHREFVMAAGELAEADFITFLETSLRNLASHSVDGSVHFVFMDWRHMHELLQAGRAVYSELKNLCVWAKTNGGLGSLYRSQHELVFAFKNGSAPHINNIELGRYGRNRTNVWSYAGVNALSKTRLDELRLHPTVKPVALIADAIKDCSKRRGIILDCFAGSGTTIIAAETTGRRARAMELDPAYVDVAITRFEKHTGHYAKHADTGLTFAETKDRRSRDCGGPM